MALNKQSLSQWCLTYGELKNYSLRKAFPDLSNKFDFMHQIWEIGCKMAITLKALEGKNQNEWLFKGIVVALFWKGLKTHLAIENLLEAGFFQDSFILLRSLLEIIINLEYIKRNPQDRVKLYLEFDYITRKRLLDAGRKVYGDKFPGSEKDDEIKELESNYQRVKNEYPKKYQWSGRSIKEMASEVGLGDLYDLIYSHLSTYVHSSASSHSSIIRNESEGLRIIIIPEQEDHSEIEKVIHFTCVFTLMLIKLYQEIFSLEYSKEVAEIEKKFKSMDVV